MPRRNRAGVRAREGGVRAARRVGWPAACVDASAVKRVFGPSAARTAVAPIAAQAPSFESRILDEKKERERELVLNALRSRDFHKGEAAAALGISRASLWRKIRELGI